MGVSFSRVPFCCFRASTWYILYIAGPYTQRSRRKHCAEKTSTLLTRDFFVLIHLTPEVAAVAHDRVRAAEFRETLHTPATRTSTHIHIYTHEGVHTEGLPYVMVIAMEVEKMSVEKR